MNANVEPTVDDRIGTTFAGKWFIERVLGAGGMAAVYLARGTDGTRVALKILHNDVNAIDEIRKRFLREGQIGNALGGEGGTPGFVRVLDAGQSEDGTAFLVMEALDGESLAQRIQRVGRMPPAEVLDLASDVLDVLVVAHARGIVHRDLKPENLHVTREGRVKVLDFGIARVLDALPRTIGFKPGNTGVQGAFETIAGLPEKTATKTGVIMGTAAYMAPEQATGLIKEIDPRTDLFALGATMFRLLSGRAVHGPVTDVQEIIAAATQPAPPLASLGLGLSSDICAVVDRSLAFVKHHRYPDAPTMRADVQALRQGKRPPYIVALEQGWMAPGQPMPRGPSSRPPETFRVAPTIIEATPRIPTTAPDSLPRVARTKPDPARSSKALLWIVALIALALGVGVGVAVTAWRASRGPSGVAPTATSTAKSR